MGVIAMESTAGAVTIESADNKESCRAILSYGAIISMAVS